MKINRAKIIFIIFFITAAAAGLYFWSQSREVPPEEKIIEEQKIDIENILNERAKSQLNNSTSSDPFGTDGMVRILVIGLDSRVGQTAGHCDAIQLLEIDKKKQTVQITAVPRGTYVPLTDKKRPPSDYYVSNSCAIEGLQYGIDQMEKILGKKADYLVMIGFSEAEGIIRQLKLPTTDTLRWLRHRQGYAIGEPQRARNHSTFIKQMMIRFIPQKDSKLDASWEYVIYKMTKTDLSFDQSRAVISALINMNLSKSPEKISLAMRPSYEVADIPYDEKNVSEYLKKMINPIKDRLSPADYSEMSKATIESNILKMLDEKKDDPDFLAWAYDNRVWLQFDEESRRLGLQYDLTMRYALSLTDKNKKITVIEDYVLEMEYSGLAEWSSKGKARLEEVLSQ
jgi:hypothetical protein